MNLLTGFPYSLIRPQCCQRMPSNGLSISSYTYVKAQHTLLIPHARPSVYVVFPTYHSDSPQGTYVFPHTPIFFHISTLAFHLRILPYVSHVVNISLHQPVTKHMCAWRRDFCHIVLSRVLRHQRVLRQEFFSNHSSVNSSGLSKKIRVQSNYQTYLEYT